MEQRPLRIAILGTRGYPSSYGGFETFVAELAPWLAARGHSVTVYGRDKHGPKESDIDGVRVVNTRGANTKSASTATHGVCAALHALRRNPDVVLALNVANGPAILLLQLRGIPIVTNVDGIEWQRAKWGRLARAAFLIGARLSARFSDILVADSREVGRIWSETFDVDPVFIPYGGKLLSERDDTAIRHLALPRDGYALAVARLAPENNVELFLDALELLDWKIPAVVVGSANYQNPVEERLERLHRLGRIKWLGHVDDAKLLSALWANAGVYFHGHSVGGTNPALLSALAAGAPTLALDTPFNREVLDSDDQLVPACSETVAKHIRQLLQDQAARSRFAEAGRRVVRQRYDWDEVRHSYEAVLRRALAESQGRTT